MSEIQFFQTPMGRQFFDGTMRELVRQLTRLCDLLERFQEDEDDPDEEQDG